MLGKVGADKRTQGNRDACRPASIRGRGGHAMGTSTGHDILGYIVTDAGAIAKRAALC